MKIHKNIKEWLIIWITASLVFLLTWTLYSAWENISKVNSWDKLNSADWNKMIDNLESVKWWAVIPKWLVAAFDSNECPEWWSKADWTAYPLDLRWEFIRWLDNWRWVDTWRTLWSFQEDMFKAHTHKTMANWGFFTLQWAINKAPIFRESETSETWWEETRPRNIALLYCVKN